MIKSACIEMIFTELDFYDRFEAAKKAGFDYVEFWGWEDKDLNKIKEKCERYDLKIASFSGDKAFSLIDIDHLNSYINFTKKSIEAAKKLDCKFLVIHSNALGEGGVVLNSYTEKSDYEKFGTMIKMLQLLAPIAEENNITLVLEALNTEKDHKGNFLCTTKDAVTAINIVSSPNIKVLYDIYHMQLMEGKISDTLRQYKGQIGYIHIADVPGRMEPGTGEINYNNVFKVLKDIQYSGVVGFELSPSRNSTEVAKELISLF